MNITPYVKAHIAVIIQNALLNIYKSLYYNSRTPEWALGLAFY